MQYVVFLGAIANIAGVYVYIKQTLKGETKPNRVTWLMWSIAPLIATVAAWSDGVRLATLPVFMAGFAPLLVFVASFINKKAYWKLEKFDYICGGLSILALILWAITKQPLVAIIFAIASDLFAAVPTLIKCWKYPETESIEAYTTGTFNAVTSFFALKTFGASELLFPIYLVVINFSLAITVYRGNILHKKLSSKVI